jgi:hypothetical protein
VFDRLLDQGHTLLLIEHNLDVIKLADWIVDMGPDGGDGGGAVVAMGRTGLGDRAAGGGRRTPGAGCRGFESLLGS